MPRDFVKEIKLIHSAGRSGWRATLHTKCAHCKQPRIGPVFINSKTGEGAIPNLDASLQVLCRKVSDCSKLHREAQGLQQAGESNSELDDIDNGEGKGSCILKKIDKRCTINSTAFTGGDYVICVEWWDRDAADAERRTFEKWDTSQSGMTQFICNSTELRLVEPDFVA